MSAEREQNGPTQVHPALNYTELTQHMQLNGLNGLNGIGMNSKPFGDRGELFFNLFEPLALVLPLNRDSNQKISNSKTSTEKFSPRVLGMRDFPRNFPHLVVFAFLSNGSNLTVTRFTPLKFISLICLAIAAKTPPDRVKAPLALIDMLTEDLKFPENNILV